MGDNILETRNGEFGSSESKSEVSNFPMEKEPKLEDNSSTIQAVKENKRSDFSVSVFPCSSQQGVEPPHGLNVSDFCNLPPVPPSATDCNFVSYFAPDFMKPGHDQYVYRHPNGLCVIGLASTHVALREKGVVTVDFNVGKSDRSEIKVSGKRKRNAQHFEPSTVLCKVLKDDTFYIVRCCVKGALLEVNERLIKHPELLSSSADREGYVAIVMPKPNDWLKVKNQLLSLEEFKKLRGFC